MLPALAALLPLLVPGDAPGARWFPALPSPRQVLVVPFANDPEEGMVLESLAGLAARRSLQGDGDTLIWEDLSSNAAYARAFAGYREVHNPEVTECGLDDAVARLRDQGFVQGYILYRYDAGERPLHQLGPRDESVSVATALAGRLGAITVSERLEGRYQALGFPLLLDARGQDEAGCLAAHDADFSRTVLCLADPKTRNVRSLAIALDAMVVSGVGEAYTRALARCEPDSPVIGWGCGGEDQLTEPSSRAGLFQTATNWCHNLPLLMSENWQDAGLAEQLGRMRAESAALPALDSDEGQHVACLTLTDGDNVQWMMGNFVSGSEGRFYYENPRRGEIPFGWGVPGPGLAQLSPRTLAEAMRGRTPNDGLVLYSAGGYFYPDVYGRGRPEEGALRLHARRMREWSETLGIRVLAFNFLDWDSDEAREACHVLAEEMPGLLGILAFQYYPYSGGQGAMYWVEGADGDQVPVVSCRLTVWAGAGRPDDTTPAAVAARLNGQPVLGAEPDADCFSWVLVHAWSYFRPAEPGAPLDAEERDVPQDGSDPLAERGYAPALSLAARLEPEVRLCTPEEFLRRVRARLER